MTDAAGLSGNSQREVIGIKRDGSRFPMELRVASWLEHDVEKHVAVMRDITERKRREAALVESEARSRQVVDHVEDGFIVRERQSGHISYVNRAFEAIVGRPVSAVPDFPESWLEWIEPDDRERLVQAHARHLAGGEFDEEYRLRLPDGTLRWVRARTFPIVEPDRTISSDVRVIQDTTERHELEEQLVQAQKVEAVGALASALAHDFNNVLQAVLGCLNVARDRSATPERVREYLDRAVDAARGGGDLSAQLMAFARKQSVAPRKLAIDAVIRRAEKLLERLVGEHVELEIEARAGNAAILADPVQIEQILLNLVANARDAMPNGGTLRIHTELQSGELEPWIGLTVQDTGTGMDTATRARIFEPFFTTKELGKGTGIGLATVFATTKQLGGRVEVDSAPGEGTRFTFRFPYAGEINEAPSREAPSVPARFSGTALVVEDEPLVRLTVRHYLEQLGFSVLDADAPDAAIEMFETVGTTIDVLVSDFVLPGMSGARLAERLWQGRADLPVLFVSANPELLAQEELSRERTRVLRKPFDQQELGAELTALLDQVGAGRATGPRTIVLVEDEPLALLALTELFESRGIRVLGATRPSQALDAFTRHGEPVDLLVSDVNLPEMSGDELALELRRAQPGLPIVLMSGQSDSPIADAHFVHKPVDFDELLETVDRALARAP